MKKQYRVIKDYYENGVKYFYIESKGWFFWTRVVDKYEEIDDGVGFSITNPVYKNYSDRQEAVDAARLLFESQKERSSKITWSSEFL